MSDYTPTANEVRADFITLHTRNFDAYTVGRSLISEQEVYGVAFDSMIAAVERTAAEKAWDEGADHGASTKCKYRTNNDDPCPENPYRREDTE